MASDNEDSTTMVSDIEESSIASDSNEESSIASDSNEESSIASDSNEESMARCLWNKFPNESFIALHTPFVVALASGTLQLVTFCEFVSQELHFLKSYAQTFELVAECSDDDYVKKSIMVLIEELKKQNSLFKNWGFDRTNEYPPNPAIVKYTDFLLATASGKDDEEKSATPSEKMKVAVYTIGAMLPHLQIYSFIGKELQSVLAASESSHPFKIWINYYSSNGFQASTDLSMVLLDKLSASLTGEDLDIIQNLYHRATKLELDFFSTQSMVQETVLPSVVPLFKQHIPSGHHFMVFSSFDFACTDLDSSDFLAEAAIEKALDSDKVKSQNQIPRISSANPRKKWMDLCKEYAEGYEQCIQSILVSKYKITNEGEKNYEVVKNALEHLSEFEKTANNIVFESGLLKGLNLEDIKSASERLILQDGCINFFQSITKDESISANVHVLSYNWCKDLIKSVFSSGDLQDTLNIHANEFIYDESKGGIVRKVEFPIDKIECVDNILQNCGSDKKKFIIYIGDSVSDLLCLLKAHIGIVIGSNVNLRRVCDCFGICIVPLLYGFGEEQKEIVKGGGACYWSGLSGMLYTVSSWTEIHSLLVGLEKTEESSLGLEKTEEFSRI